MRYRVLGQLCVEYDKGSIPLQGRRKQVVLAVLLLEANHVVPVDRLVDALWGEDPPASARGQVQICVSQLRRRFADAGEPDAIVTHPAAYLLRIPAGSLDADVFEDRLRSGRAAARADQLEEALRDLRHALDLWRGPALEGLESAVIQQAATRLNEGRLQAWGECLEIELQLGRHMTVTHELTWLVSENPLHEGLRAQLMVALYRSGRQADALKVYREGRRLSVEELGIEPGKQLQSLEHAILVGDPGLELAPQPLFAQSTAPAQSDVTPPRQLPADIPDFTGREKHMERIREILNGSEDGATAVGHVPVVVVSGRSGSGKTTLAVHVAHQLDWCFPGGQLFASMGNDDSEQTGPAQILGRFLRALGAAPRALPESLDERAELYRSRLAGKRVLIVLDDALDERDVLPLLPGDSSCAVIISSRKRLIGLDGAQHVDVDPLTSEQAVQMLRQIAGWERIDGEAPAALLLAEQCGRLPLALRIAGAKLAARRFLTVERMVKIFSDQRQRLDELTMGGRSIRASMALSYNGLDEEGRLLLRRLSSLRHSEVPSWVGAALVDSTLAEGEAVLDRLAESGMVEIRPGPGGNLRCRLHDLVGAFALERLAAEEPEESRRAAVRRVVSGWLQLAGNAHAHLYGGSFTRLRSTTRPNWWLSAQEAEAILALEPLEWWERERDSLRSAVLLAATVGESALAADLALTCVGLYESRSYYDDWRITHRHALAAAEAYNDRRAQGMMRYSLGALAVAERQLEQAVEHLGVARLLFNELGEEYGTALALRNLAFVDRIRGRFEVALDRYRESLDILRRCGDLTAEAHVMSNMALVYMESERVADAARLLGDALNMSRLIGNRRITAQVLSRLADMHLRQGEYTNAVVRLEEALPLVLRQQDRLGEAHIRYGLASGYEGRGERGKGRWELEAALEIVRDVSEPLLEAHILRVLGRMDAEDEDRENAVARLTRARLLYIRLNAGLWVAQTDEALQRVLGLRGLDDGVCVQS